ncbi:hypothetical protein [Nocardioides mesophilus]|uniref:DUF946 domain-containing protein n=1 Tax=Nocardioides mesophilus TaxID=433659 RepID=A0A7G9R897_9ACTN|nr:hypothetical protein [Nocardioides mesophilus]QNN51822.1 hypothetical protein H9L09_14925 [Nocardioides mesophilus]
MAGAAAPAGAAQPGTSDEQALAEKYAPVLMLQVQKTGCGSGEPYQPSSVDPLLQNPSIALRGPWTPQDIVKVAPGAARLARGLPGYSLDFPGNPLAPGCSYEQWAAATWQGTPPTVYAHVATEKGHPDRLALQYYFFYPYNDFNNKHEGDWERIQVEFAAASARAALQTEPVLTAYSQHYGSENATWGGSDLEVMDRTHPVVYVSTGSHASHYTSALFLGRSGAQGFGCDTTLGPNRTVRPDVVTIPSDPTTALERFPWIGYEGHWGERGTLEFYDGPTGPNMKPAWTKPFSWSEQGRSRSYAVPGGQAYGGAGTAFFCSAVSGGSEVLRVLTVRPAATLGVLVIALLVVVWLVRRTSWRDSAPLPLEAARTTGQVIAVSWQLLRQRFWLFAGIATPVVIVSAGATLLQEVLLPGDPNAAPPAWFLAGHVLLLLLALLLAQAATIQAASEVEAGRHVTPLSAYRLVRPAAPRLLATGALVLLVLTVLGASLALAVMTFVCVWAWCLFVPVVVREETRGFRSLLRSWRLVRREKVTVLSVPGLSLLLGSLVGGLLGTLVILVVQAPFAVVNMVPSLAALVLQPFVSLMLLYAYFNGRAHEALSPQVPASSTASSLRA